MDAGMDTAPQAVVTDDDNRLGAAVWTPDQPGDGHRSRVAAGISVLNEVADRFTYRENEHVNLVGRPSRVVHAPGSERATGYLCHPGVRKRRDAKRSTQPATNALRISPIKLTTSLTRYSYLGDTR
jgi:hypothetical protein